jgi:hypothetical protein
MSLCYRGTRLSLTYRGANTSLQSTSGKTSIPFETRNRPNTFFLWLLFESHIDGCIPWCVAFVVVHGERVLTGCSIDMMSILTILRFGLVFSLFFVCCRCCTGIHYCSAKRDMTPFGIERQIIVQTLLAPEM